jgi:hypothetical protein
MQENLSFRTHQRTLGFSFVNNYVLGSCVSGAILDPGDTTEKKQASFLLFTVSRETLIPY